MSHRKEGLILIIIVMAIGGIVFYANHNKPKPQAPQNNHQPVSLAGDNLDISQIDSRSFMAGAEGFAKNIKDAGRCK